MRISIIAVAFLGSSAVSLALGVAHADKAYSSGKGATWDCTKDPVVSINHGMGAYTFTGACKTITINGGMNKLKIEKVDTLHVEGGMNTIDVANVTAIKVNGSTNTITYKGGEPKIDVVGSNNKVSKGA